MTLREGQYRPSMKKASVQFTIRAGVASDSEALAAVHVAAWEASYRGLVPQGINVDSGVFDDVVYAFDDLRALAARSYLA